MRTIAVLTSGGDAPGMNAALRAIARVGAAAGVNVKGVEDGYEGLVDGRFRPLTRRSRKGGLSVDPELDLLGGRGGTLLGSARSARFRTPDGRLKAAENLKALEGLAGLIVVGGDGSLTGARALEVEHGIRVIGVPASIDNDVGCTSTAIGVDTALNTIVEACDRIGDTARAHRRAFVIEVMGRQCGYLAMAGAVAAGADAVLFREQGRDEATIQKAVADVIRKSFEQGKRRVLILKAEGVAVPCTKLVREVEAALTPELPGVEIRATVLGHVVRGGNASYQDRMVAGRLGLAAVQALLAGRTDEMAAWQPPLDEGTPTPDPAVRLVPLTRVLEECRALVDGTSAVTKRRVRMMESIEGVLAL